MIYIDKAGHLISDKSEDELHIFAKKLGLKKEWFQNNPKHPHYDVTTNRMRNKAIDIGAILINSKEIVKIFKRRNCNGK